MEYRTLGRTDLKVSEIGYGCWGLGGSPQWLDGDDAEARKALRLAFDMGINFFDTALAYGEGNSEKKIGGLAKEVGREKIIIASKVPPMNLKWPAPCGISVSQVFPPSHIRQSTEATLKNLGTDYIDVHQLHVWQDPWLEQDDWKNELLKLKKEGKIRFIGVSINDHDPLSGMLLVQTEIADSVQVIYNIFDQSPEDALFPLCESENIGVIARVPFDEGSLTGMIHEEIKFPAGDFRELYFKDNRPKEVVEHVDPLKALLGKEAKTLPELALRFCLSNPTVSTVIPGMRKTVHVESNTVVSDGRYLSKELLATLKNHAWPRNYYP